MPKPPDGEEDEFSDDEEFTRALNESMLVQDKRADPGPTPGPSSGAGPTPGPSSGAGPSSVAGTPLETLPGFDLSAGGTWIYPTNKSFR